MPPFAACPLLAPACPVGSCVAVAGARRTYPWCSPAGCGWAVLGHSWVSQSVNQSVTFQECHGVSGRGFCWPPAKGAEKLLYTPPPCWDGPEVARCQTQPKEGVGDVWACFQGTFAAPLTDVYQTSKHCCEQQQLWYVCPLAAARLPS